MSTMAMDTISLPDCSIPIFIGSGGPKVAITWEFDRDQEGNPLEITGEIVLQIVDRYRREILRKSTANDDGLVKLANGATWTPTVEETSLIPEGNLASYSLDNVAGESVWPLIPLSPIVAVWSPPNG